MENGVFSSVFCYVVFFVIDKKTSICESFKKVAGSSGQGMTERTGEFRMSKIEIMKNYKLHRYPNAI